MLALIRLPDLPLPSGVIPYFDEHPREFALLNRKEKVSVPLELVAQIRKYVIVNYFGCVKESPQKEEKVPNYQMGSEGMPADEPLKSTAPSIPSLEDSLQEELLSIHGVGKKVASDLLELCGHQREVLIDLLIKEEVYLRRDLLRSLQEHFGLKDGTA